MTYPASSHLPHFLQIEASCILWRSRVAAMARSVSSRALMAMTSKGAALSSDRRSAPKPERLHHTAPFRSRFSANLSHNRTSAAENSVISATIFEVSTVPLVGRDFISNCRDIAVTTGKRVNARTHGVLRFLEIKHRIFEVPA